MNEREQPPPYDVQQPPGDYPVQSSSYGHQQPPQNYPMQSSPHGYKQPPGEHPVQSSPYGFQPPPAGPPAQSSQSGIVFMQSLGGGTSGGTMNAAVGPGTQKIICPSCHDQVWTKVETKATSKTHLWALCLFCCLCWPLVCVPYCMTSCNNSCHYCPNCGAFIGEYKS